MDQPSSIFSVSNPPIGSGDFVRDFLFGNAVIQQVENLIRASICMDLRTEGWIGIPHGGIGMGAVMELAMALMKDPKGSSPYPISADFRMGGASLRIGDTVEVEVSRTDDGAAGAIIVPGNSQPYVSASITHTGNDPRKQADVLSYLPARYADMERWLIPLPYYQNCFVCGAGRIMPGLRRRFFLLDKGQTGKIVVSPVGFDPADQDTFFRFQRNKVVHPVAFLALIDETVGWAGFMASASGAVTVRIGYTFYRDVHVDEKVVVFGRGDRVRGKAGSRLLFWASGGAAVVDSDGRLEPVITASGQWLGMPELTEQMKAALIPAELTLSAFAIAGAQS